MIRPKHFLIVAILAILSSADALACSCMGGGGPACQEAWGEGVNSIFLGRVAKIEVTLGVMGAPNNAASMTPSGNMKVVTIEIEESYRGISGKSVQVLTAADEAACGYSFQEGERYLVFAGKQGGRLGVSLCSATRPAKYAEEDIAYLRSIPGLPQTARGFGTFKRYTYDPKFKPTCEPSIMDHYRPPEEEYRAMAAMTGTLVRIETSDGKHETTVDNQGKWSMSGLPPGPYKIEVALPKNMILDPAFGIRGSLSPKGCWRVDLRAESNGHIRGHISSEVPLSDYYLAQVGLFRAEEAEIDLIRPFGEVFPDQDTGDYDIGPLPPGRYLVAVILNNKDLDVAALYYPGVVNLDRAKVIALSDGETLSKVDFRVGKPFFRERPTCCEFKIHVPKLGSSR